MTTLLDLKTALKNQFIDLYRLAIPEASQEEAIRRSLARLNLALGGSAGIAGLDGCLTSTLPADWQLPLLEGASAQLIDYSLRNQMARGSSDGFDQLCFERRADWLQEKFEASIEYLRTLNLQMAMEQDKAVWELDR